MTVIQNAYQEILRSQLESDFYPCDTFLWLSVSINRAPLT